MTTPDATPAPVHTGYDQVNDMAGTLAAFGLVLTVIVSVMVPVCAVLSMLAVGR